MKIILFRDYKEENWTSMDVYADNLTKSLQSLYGKTLSVTEHITLPHISHLFSSKHKQTRQIFRYLVNPIGSISKKADVYHITDHANAHLLAVLNPKQTVVTCHDLTAPYWMMGYVRPTVKKKIKHAIERWRVRFMRRAAKIIAVSDATKNDIVRYLHVPEERIVVIPEGVSPVFVPCKDTKKIRNICNKYKLPARYVLHVGTNYYNKNIEGLLSLFFSLAEHVPDLYLVKIGEQWTDEQKRTISLSRFSGRILHIGFVKTEELSVIYSNAKALIQPSYAEGFGFTVLEAMACGCPVAISAIPALQELVGKNGIQIHLPPTRKEITDIQHLLSNKNIQHRYRARGLIRSKQYSWATCAKRTRQVYEEIVRQNLKS